MSLFNLSAKLALDSSAYEKGLSDSESRAKSFGKSIASGLGNAAKAVGRATVAAVGAATTATVAFAKTAVTVGQTFDTSMSQVAATMGKTMDEMAEEVGTVDTAWGTFSGNLRDYAQFMGSNTAFSASQAADALNYMALAGYDAETSMRMLPNVLNLAAAGSLDLAYASDMITDSQTALGLSLEETNVLVDQMAKTASTTNTSVGQLGEAILTLGGTAQFMFSDIENGIPVTNELNKVLGVLADNGIKGAEAGTHLRNMLLKLSAPTEQGAKWLDEFGIAIYDADGKMRKFEDIFGELNVAMEGFTDESRVQALSDIFNARDVAAATALLNTNAKRWKEVGSAIDAAEGSAQKMADVQLDNLSGDVTLFKSALEGAQIVVSDALTPTLRNFVQFGTNAVSRLGTAFKERGLAGAMEALGEILSDGVAMIAGMLPQMIDAGISLLKALLQGIVDNLDLIIDAGVQIIMSLVGAFTNNIDLLVDGVIVILTGIVNAITENIGMILQSAITIINALTSGIIEAIPILLESVPTILKSLGDTIISNLPTIIELGFQLMEALIDGIFSSLPAIISAIADIIGTLVQYIVEHLPEFMQRGMDITMSLINGIIDNLPQIIVTIIQLIVTIITTIMKELPKIFEKGSDILFQLIDGLISAIPALVGAIPTIIKAIIEAFGKADWGAIGKNIIEGIKNGVMNFGQNLLNSVKNLASSVLNAFKNLFGIHSPSTVFRDQIGKMVDKGFAIGIDSGKEDVLDSARGVIEDTLGEFDGIDADISRNFNLNAEGVENDVVRPSGGVIINVYGAEGQNINDLAEIISEKIAFGAEREKVVWA